MNMRKSFEKRLFANTDRGSALILAGFVLFGLIWYGPSAVEVLGAETLYTRTDQVSNGHVWTPNVDSSLVNPWGIVSPRQGPWWVVNEGRGRATLYTGEGISFPGLSPLVVTIPVNPGGVYDYSTPTGIVFNGTDSFELASGAPSRFIFVTRDGTIAGWNENVNRYYAVLVVDNSPAAVYTGAAIARFHEDNALYVANFRQGRVDVFGPDFSPLLLDAGAFTDPLIPDGFAPYNIQNIDGEIYVTFAEPLSAGRDAASGEGMGYIDVFDTEGKLIMRFEHGPWMDAPWGIALAPPIGFGEYSSTLLAGNNGSGRIAAFDVESGAFTGYLTDTQGTTLTIAGLHALGFGNNGLAGPSTTLFFSAGFHDNKKQSIFGTITAVTLPLTTTPPLESGMNY
ncbi:MAG: TIGR03118 family protein [Betaproteobacteria bacterium]